MIHLALGVAAALFLLWVVCWAAGLLLMVLGWALESLHESKPDMAESESQNEIPPRASGEAPPRAP